MLSQRIAQTNPYVKTIHGITFIDVIALENSIPPETPPSDRLRQKMIKAGVIFWDADQTIVKIPVIGISAIGGLSINLEAYEPGQVKFHTGTNSYSALSINDLADGLRQSMGSQSAHTYMNPKGKNVRELYDVTVKFRHFSIAHAAAISITAFGISKKAELEFDAQRDLIHVARETSARCIAQDEPTLFAMTEIGAQFAKQIRTETIQKLKLYDEAIKLQSKKDRLDLDMLEDRNDLFPLAACVSLGMNGSLRNFQKMLGAINDQGKELEYRNALAMINDSIHGLFPELFQSTFSYGHRYPVYWQEPKRAILLLGAPGVGKSTQALRITSALPGLVSVSSGNLVRKLNSKVESKAPLTPVEQKAAESLDLMRKGGLMDDRAVYALFMEYLSPGGDGYEAYTHAHTIILDGVIKTRDNIEPFKEALDNFNAKSSTVPMSFSEVININATEEELVKRHVARVNEAISKGLAQRPDDATDVYRLRLSTYIKNTDSLLGYYRANNQFKLTHINGSQDIAETTQALLAAIDTRIKLEAKDPLDTLVKLNLKTDILYKPNKTSHNLRAVVITSNAKKAKEFMTQLSDGYGMTITQWDPGQGIDLNNQAALTAECLKIMDAQKYSPHFILREETLLQRVGRNNQDITSLPMKELEKLKLENVVHTSSLTIFKPQWNNEKLSHFTRRTYEKRSYGYISQDPQPESHYGFGWDSLFVNAATNLTNEQFYKTYGKKSARQHTVSVFIETYLRYKALISMKHHNLPLINPIDFGDEHQSVAKFVSHEKHLSNPFIADWGIKNLRNAMINEGMFFKAAWSRSVKNYFSTPFSGLPLTAKKDEVEETVFLTHDMLHHLICDLICDIPSSKEGFNVYSAWRMMSEACTMVLADMLYADGLIKSGVDRPGVDKRIYPLFEAIKEARGVSDPALMKWEDKIQFIKRLLRANVNYALLGNDSEYRMLLSNQGVISSAHEAALTAYKNHFGKFFIGDTAWTRANYDNMHKNESQPIKQWIEDIGRDTFRNSHIPLLSDVTSNLQKADIATDDYKNLVNPLFEYIFKHQIKSLLKDDVVELEDQASLQSRAFRRFLIGQATLFSRYPTPLNLGEIRSGLFKRLKDPAPFSNNEQAQIRGQLKQYILGIEGLRLISREEALNAIDCSPVFPPVYISYSEMEGQYGSIEKCVEDCINAYTEVTPPVVEVNPNKRLKMSASIFN